VRVVGKAAGAGEVENLGIDACEALIDGRRVLLADGDDGQVVGRCDVIQRKVAGGVGHGALSADEHRAAGDGLAGAVENLTADADSPAATTATTTAARPRVWANSRADPGLIRASAREEEEEWDRGAEATARGHPGTSVHDSPLGWRTPMNSSLPWAGAPARRLDPRGRRLVTALASRSAGIAQW
jgi:hypothetical protein